MDLRRTIGAWPVLRQLRGADPLGRGGPVAALTAASGLVVAVRMYETHRRTPPTPGPLSGDGRADTQPVRRP